MCRACVPPRMPSLSGVDVVWQLVYFKMKWNCCAVCRGTSHGFGGHSEAGRNVTLTRYRNNYENCTHVDGNLEIVYIEHGPNDLSFLSSIQEVLVNSICSDIYD